MKFIVNSLSIGMFLTGNITLHIHELEWEEFEVLCRGAESYVKHTDIAQLIDVKLNRSSLKARPGDVLLLAQLDNEVLRFYCIQVSEPEAPLKRQQEIAEEA